MVLVFPSKTQIADLSVGGFSLEKLPAPPDCWLCSQAHRLSAHGSSAHGLSAHGLSAHRLSAHGLSAHRTSAHRKSAHGANSSVASHQTNLMLMQGSEI